MRKGGQEKERKEGEWERERINGVWKEGCRRLNKKVAERLDQVIHGKVYLSTLAQYMELTSDLGSWGNMFARPKTQCYSAQLLN